MSMRFRAQSKCSKGFHSNNQIETDIQNTWFFRNFLSDGTLAYRYSEEGCRKTDHRIRWKSVTVADIIVATAWFLLVRALALPRIELYCQWRQFPELLFGIGSTVGSSFSGKHFSSTDLWMWSARFSRRQTCVRWRELMTLMTLKPCSRCRPCFASNTCCVSDTW